LPIKSDQFKNGIESLQDKIIDLNVSGVGKRNFTKPAEHHLTLLMLDLSDPEKLERAKLLLKEQEKSVKALAENISKEDLSLTFWGVGTFNKPSKARLLFTNIEDDLGQQLVTRIVDQLIRKFLEEGLVTESELSHIKVKEGLFQPEFHLTFMRARNGAIDASSIIQQFKTM
jgi:2'-5' RNA ligase